MAKFFISYRREDSQHQADRLHSALARYVLDPSHDIFIDVDNIPFGVDFVEHLGGKVSQCEVLLALIGDRWLAADAETGQRRIDEPEDFVRIEIVQALERGIPVVPILLDGTSMPSADSLPDELKPLARRNGVPIQRLIFDADVARLINGLPIQLPNRPIEAAFTSVSDDGGAAKMWGSVEHSLDPRDYEDFKEHFSISKWAFEAGRRVRQLKDWSDVDHDDADRIAEFRRRALDIAPLFDALDEHIKKAMRRANDHKTRATVNKSTTPSAQSTPDASGKHAVLLTGKVILIVGVLATAFLIAIRWYFETLP